MSEKENDATTQGCIDTTKKPEIPVGYMMDAKGRLIPESMVKPVDKLRDELVNSVYEKCLEMNAALGEFKRQILSEILGFCDLSASEYGIERGGDKGNITLTSFDGSTKITIDVQEFLSFDEQINAAKVLIDECTTEWTEGGRDEVKVLIQDAFDSKDGRLSSKKILGLRKFGFEDPRWKLAMDAISNAVQVTGTKRYLRIYTKDAMGKYQPIALDGTQL